MPLLADTHCHLYFELFRQDLRDVLERAEAGGITRIMIPGIDLETSRQAIKLTETYAGLYAAVGIHPNDITGNWTENTLKELEALAQHPNVLAIGEIGLDYYRDYTPKDLQQEVFKDQLELATSLGLPVIIHNREAISDLWPILLNWQSKNILAGSPLAFRPGVLHSFDGDLEIADQAIQNHFLIGVSGPVTFKNAKDRQEMISALPLQALVLETDAPFLTPHPFRGRRNEPVRITNIAQKLAELKGLSVEEVANATSRNANDLFQWKID